MPPCDTVSKFQQLLRDKYPDDSPSVFLQRLTKMWELHKRERRFGLTCSHGCDCEEFWGISFYHGDVLGDLPAVASRKRRSSPEQTPLPRVPRKRPQTQTPQVHDTLVGGSVEHQNQVHYVAPMSSLLPNPHPPDAGARDAASVNTRKQGNLMAPLNHPERFLLCFNTGIPLGFFSTTERTLTSTVCTIVSIDPSGACTKKNSHIQTRTRGKHSTYIDCSFSLCVYHAHQVTRPKLRL